MAPPRLTLEAFAETLGGDLYGDIPMQPPAPIGPVASPRRAGRGPQFPRATAWPRAATQAPFCGLLLRSAKGAARTAK
jgi:hypothetical protein